MKGVILNVAKLADSPAGLDQLPSPHRKETMAQVLMDFLDRHQVAYRVVTHASAGSSQAVAQARGSRLEQGAKAMVFELARDGAPSTFALAVVPSHARVSAPRLAAALGAKKARLAVPDIAERLTGCIMGTVPPFSFQPDLHLVVDPTLLAEDEIVFNAASLDKSIFLKSDDYRRVAQPAIATIIQHT